MPVFQVSTRSTNGATFTTPWLARSKTLSNHSFDAWSSTQAIAAVASPIAVSGPQNIPARAAIRRSLRGLAHGFPFAERLRVARRDVGILRIRADIMGNFPGPRAFAAFGEVHDDRDTRHIGGAERLGRALAVDQRRRRRDADLGQIDIDHRLEQFG